MSMIRFAVIGGDMRQAYLASILQKEGYRVAVHALENDMLKDCEVIEQLDALQERADVVLLPIPVQTGTSGQLYAPMTDKLQDLQVICYHLPSTIPVFAGAVPQWMCTVAEQNGLDLIDYMKREELALRNAVPTCEGAIQIAMQEMVDTLHGTDCLIVGNGRIGKLLAHRMAAMGANVTVAARSAADFAHIFANGFQSIPTAALETQIGRFQLIFNTVPALVFDQQTISNMRAPCLLIDLASFPGGVAPKVQTPSGCQIRHELSLPGRVAPLAAARAMKDTIFAGLRERGLIK